MRLLATALLLGAVLIAVAVFATSGEPAKARPATAPHHVSGTYQRQQCLLLRAVEPNVKC